MKVIVAGSRDISGDNIVDKAVTASGFDIIEVVSGGARGIDALGEEWAFRNQRKLKIFSADWDRYGRSAGPIRNLIMADYADALIAIWRADRHTPGTAHMIQTAIAKGLKVYIYEL